MLRKFFLSALMVLSINAYTQTNIENVTLRANMANGAVEYLDVDGIWEKMSADHPLFDQQYTEQTEGVLVEWLSLIHRIYKSPQWSCGKVSLQSVVRTPACYNDGPVEIRNILEMYRAECARECSDCSHLNAEKITRLNDNSCNSAHVYFAH